MLGGMNEIRLGVKLLFMFQRKLIWLVSNSSVIGISVSKVKRVTFVSFAVEKHHSGAAAMTTADSSAARLEQSLTFHLKAQRVATKQDHLWSWQRTCWTTPPNAACLPWKVLPALPHHKREFIYTCCSTNGTTSNQNNLVVLALPD